MSCRFLLIPMTLESTPLHLRNLLLREAVGLGKSDVDLDDVDTLHQMPDRHGIHLDEVAPCPKPDRRGIHLDVDAKCSKPDRLGIHLEEVVHCSEPDRLGIHLDEVAHCSKPDHLGIHLDEVAHCSEPELVHIHHHFHQANDLRNLYVASCQNCQPDLDGIHHQGTLC